MTRWRIGGVVFLVLALAAATILTLVLVKVSPALPAPDIGPYR